MSLLNDASGVILRWTDNRNARLGLCSLVLSGLAVAIMFLITAVTYDQNGLQFNPKDSYRLASVITFLLLFVASWFILYLLSAKDATDVYSEVRQALDGNWIVAYEQATGPASKEIVSPRQLTACTIEVSPEKN